MPSASEAAASRSTRSIAGRRRWRFGGAPGVADAHRGGDPAAEGRHRRVGAARGADEPVDVPKEPEIDDGVLARRTDPESACEPRQTLPPS
jgi:hypothetical protein